jgi:hypothetical protein
VAKDNRNGPERDVLRSAHELVEALTRAKGPSAPVDVVAVRGYSAGQVGPGPEPGGDPENPWVLFYLDVSLERWLLVRTKDIVAAEAVTDDTLPYGGYDVIWIKKKAPCGRGTGPFSIQARFLAGDFAAAGSVDPSSYTGGTYAPPTGLLCDATVYGKTPRCPA